MTQLRTCCLAILLCSTPALADDAPPAGGADMSKMGPMARVPKKEKQDLKELQEWFKSFQAADEKNDIDVMTAMIDFPILMITDTMKGQFKYSETSKDQWVAMMKPYLTPEAKKGMKASNQKSACHLISDDLASCEGEVTMQVGKVKAKVNNQMIMTRVDGIWRTKSMMEAGWGDMGPNPAAAPAAK